MRKSRSSGHDYQVRIGIIQSGALAGERVVQPGEPFTVGTDPRCALRVEAGPERHRLLWCERGVWRVAPHPALELSVASGSGAPAAVAAGPRALGPGDRARVRVGDRALLLQLVPQPLGARGLRPRLLEEDDVPFLTSLNVFAALGVALVIWTLSTPVAAETRIDDATRELLARIPVPPRLPEIERPNHPGGEARDAEVRRAPERPRPELRPRPGLEDNPLMAALRLVGSREGRHDIFSREDDGLERLGVALDKVDGTYALNDPGPSVRVSERDDDGDRDIADLEQARDGGATVSESVRVKPDRDSLLSAPPTLSGDIDAEARVVVKAGAGGLISCYERALNQDPHLAGRVELSWEVQAGRVVRVVVEENTTGDDELGRCMTDRVRGWRFKASSNGSIVYPFILTPRI